MVRGGVYDELRVEMAKKVINSLVPTIEFYKTQIGKYPKSLEELKESLSEGSLTFLYDPSAKADNPFSASSKKPHYFYYELLPDSSGYYLLSLGADGKPFTKDDILPEVKGDKGGIGLQIKQL
jgi:hypothetical protein